MNDSYDEVMKGLLDKEKHWYYLHVNGELIHKRLEPDPSDFVVKIWEVDITERASAWVCCIEALAMGAKKERVTELATLWGLTDEDAQMFVEITKGGENALNLFKDGDQWCATFHDFVDIQESQCGFGDTALEAFAELAKQGLVKKEA